MLSVQVIKTRKTLSEVFFQSSFDSFAPIKDDSNGFLTVNCSLLIFRGDNIKTLVRPFEDIDFWRNAQCGHKGKKLIAFVSK